MTSGTKRPIVSAESGRRCISGGVAARRRWSGCRAGLCLGEATCDHSSHRTSHHLAGQLFHPPKTLRYRILHTAARLTRSGRRRRLQIAATWPWSAAIMTAWDRITALPQAP